MESISGAVFGKRFIAEHTYRVSCQVVLVVDICQGFYVELPGALE